jgi:hypothetical protein
MLTLLSATSGQAFRVSCSSSACRGKGGARFNSKPSNVRKFVTGPDHRICRSQYSLAIFRTRLRAGQLPRDSGSFATDRSAGHIDPDARSVGVFQRCHVVVHGLYGEVYETSDWIASTPPRRLGNGQNAGAEFGRTFACSPCHPRRVQVCPGRRRRPGDGAIAVGGHPPAQAETQSDFRYGVEGLV